MWITQWFVIGTRWRYWDEILYLCGPHFDHDAAHNACVDLRSQNLVCEDGMPVRWHVRRVKT